MEKVDFISSVFLQMYSGESTCWETLKVSYENIKYSRCLKQKDSNSGNWHYLGYGRTETRKVIVKKLEIVGGYCYLGQNKREGDGTGTQEYRSTDECRTMASSTETASQRRNSHWWRHCPRQKERRLPWLLLPAPTSCKASQWTNLVGSQLAR